MSNLKEQIYYVQRYEFDWELFRIAWIVHRIANDKTFLLPPHQSIYPLSFSFHWSQFLLFKFYEFQNLCSPSERSRKIWILTNKNVSNLTLTSINPRCSVLKPPMLANSSFISAVMWIFRAIDKISKKKKPKQSKWIDDTSITMTVTLTSGSNYNLYKTSFVFI